MGLSMGHRWGEMEVSMKSGLEGRNNVGARWRELETAAGLNEVRPRRPEQ